MLRFNAAHTDVTPDVIPDERWARTTVHRHARDNHLQGTDGQPLKMQVGSSSYSASSRSIG